MNPRQSRLTLHDPPQREKRGGHFYVLAHCACGADAWVRSDKIAKRKSCGCEPREMRRAAHERKALPRQRSRRIPDELRSTHTSWYGMFKRCRAGTKSYIGRYHKWYGNVAVCERWKKFDAFVEDMGRRPSRRHTLDRYPDNDGNYEPGNCRWATHSEQALNRRPRRRNATERRNA